MEVRIPSASRPGREGEEAPLQPAAAAEDRRAVEGKTFCEFFAGIGLVREGLLASGWSCVYANDIDPRKRALYEARFGRSDHFHEGDVWRTAEAAGRIPGRPFLATASFPCVDLSLAGHYRGLQGDHSSTFFGFARVLAALAGRRPRAVLLENVTGLLTSRKGEDFAAVARTLAELGYWLDAFVVDAKHFVPQSRPRVFLVGVAEGPRAPGAARRPSPDGLRPARLLALMERVSLPTGWLFLDLPALPVRRTQLAELIDLDDGQEWWDAGEVERHRRMMSDRHRRQVERLLAEGGTHVGTIYRRVRHGSQRAEVRLDGVAGCLRTPRGGSARQIVIVLERGRVRMRWMAPREYARLQGAGDFPLVGDRIRLLYGFGDAVCVPAVRWIDQHVLSPLFDAAAPFSREP
jgi:DNA (cytosine-5)-methyltransferase 1